MEEIYREVKREAVAGDIIKVVAAVMSLGAYEHGDILRVKKAIKKNDDTRAHVYVTDPKCPCLLTEEYVVLELKEDSLEELL